MTHVYIIKHQTTGAIEAVCRHLHQAAKVIYGYGDGSLQNELSFTEQAIEIHMSKNASLLISYSDGTILLLEHHAVEG